MWLSLSSVINFTYDLFQSHSTTLAYMGITLVQQTLDWQFRALLIFTTSGHTSTISHCKTLNWLERVFRSNNVRFRHCLQMHGLAFVILNCFGLYFLTRDPICTGLKLTTFDSCERSCLGETMMFDMNIFYQLSDCIQKFKEVLSVCLYKYIEKIPLKIDHCIKI